MKYIVLPLDEPHFIIDANTRAIGIPNEFKKNGIAVEGDDLAETIYFEIDRYFDSMDFNNCLIYVQCELPKTKEKVIFPVEYKDIASKPGKLIFGWPVSSNITNSAGALKFSVQFYQTEEKDGATQIVYSFNTLTASINIQSSIGIDPMSEEVVKDVIGDRLFDRIKDSQVAGNAEAKLPTLIYDFDEAEYDLGEDNTYRLIIQGTSEDTGAISYQWKRYGLDEDNTILDKNIALITSDLIESPYYLKVEDKSAVVATRTYYYEQNGGYNSILGSEIPALEAEAPRDYYEKVSSYVANITDEKLRVPAAYLVEVTNRVSNSSASQKSKFAKFPGPLVPTVGENVSSSHQGILTNGEENLSITATASSNKEKISYQWQKSSKHGLNEVIDENDLTNVGTDAASCVVTEPGNYRVVVSSSRNGETKTAEPTKWIRITNAAATPIIKPFGVNENKFSADSFTNDPDATNLLKIELDETVESDGYEVIWYVYEGNNLQGELFKETLKPGVRVSSFNPLDYKEKIYTITKQDNIAAFYWATVINTVNGSTATTAPITNTTEMLEIYLPVIVNPDESTGDKNSEIETEELLDEKTPVAFEDKLLDFEKEDSDDIKSLF